MAVPLLLHTFINESHVTQTKSSSLQNTPPTQASQATFDLNFRDEKLPDLHMFNGNIMNSIVIVNLYLKQ